VCGFWSLVIVVSLMVRVMPVPSKCGSWFGFQVGFRFSGASGFHELGQPQWSAWPPDRGDGRPRPRTRDVSSARVAVGKWEVIGALRLAPVLLCQPLDRARGPSACGGFRVRPVCCRGGSLPGLLAGYGPGVTGEVGPARPGRGERPGDLEHAGRLSGRRPRRRGGSCGRRGRTVGAVGAPQKVQVSFGSPASLEAAR
jgi:hypothetical protein